MTADRPFVHVFATFGAGGPQIRAVQLLAALGPGRRHVVVAMDGRTEALAQVPQGLAVRCVPPPPRAGMLATVRALRTLLRAERPALVLTYNWGAIEAVWAARSAGLPLVHHEDGFLPDEAVRRLRRRSWLRRWLLARVPVVVPSAVLRGIATREWHLGNVHHLPNGVDLERFRPAPAPAACLVGTVGGLRPEKDHDTLLRALAELPMARAELVGAGPLEGALRSTAAALGLADRVQFAGATHDTAACYQRFGVFVLSSATEQLPLVLLEAMASGLPVVATDVGDVRATLPEGSRRFVVPPRAPQALAKALAELLADPALRATLGAANRAAAEQRFDARTCLSRFLDLYARTARG
ncbi:MAG: glycosyltransferase [Planctomycetes bacterium]|nr:glycosyltransferase [Planctomycetota bacterium]